jgi:predicted dehydrogenase
MSDAPPIRVGQIGVANFGGYRRDSLRRSGAFRIVSAFDLNAEALAKSCAEDHCRSADSAEQLIQDPEVEAVVISTGANSHASLALAALAAGKHVLVEKPLCTSPQECEDLLAAAQRSGLVAAVGHTEPESSPVFRQTRDLIARELGRVAAYEKTTCHSGGLQIKAGDWRGDPARNPGGMLFQCGVHAFHELNCYFGPISAVAAVMRHDVNPTTGTADTAQCLIRHLDGTTGTVCAYHVTPYRHTLVIHGVKATLARDERYFTEGTILTLQRQRDNAEEVRERLTIATETGSELGNVLAFAAAIRSGQALTIDFAAGVRALAPVFTADESQRQGGALVRCSDVMGPLATRVLSA